MQSTLKYDGPLRPFVKREEGGAHIHEGKAAQFHGHGSTAGAHLQDVFVQGSDLYEAKQYQPTEMYQGNPEGFFMQSFARYHPHGGRYSGMEGYMPGAHAGAPVQQQMMPSGGSRYMGVVPEMMIDPVTRYDNAAVGLQAMRQEAMGVSIEDIQRMQMYQSGREEATQKTPRMDPVSLQKRKRNRIAQKKYRERKKMETTRVQSELDCQKSQLVKMEKLSMEICEHHTRNAVLTKLQESKDEEIAALKAMLAGIKDAAQGAAEGSSSGVATTDKVHARDLDCTNEKTIVMDIVGDKFVEDSFADVVRDLKSEVHGHISCERRLPLLLNLVQERLLKAEDSPHYHSVPQIPVPGSPKEGDAVPVQAVEVKREEETETESEDEQAPK